MTRGGGSFGELYISIRYIIHHRYPFMVLLVRGLLRVGPLTERMVIDSWVSCFLAVEGKGTYFDVGS